MDEHYNQDISIGNVEGKGIIIGENIQIGDINIDSINHAQKKNRSEYLEGLKNFSENLNEQFYQSRIPSNKIQQVQESVLELQKEIQDIRDVLKIRLIKERGW